MKDSVPTKEYVDMICDLYNDVYDDRIENCRPPAAGESFRTLGKDWVTGQVTAHKSLIAFQGELEEKGIKLSSSKSRKILVNGGRWSTELSREIGHLFDLYTKTVSDGDLGLSGDAATVRIVEELGVSIVALSVNLSYQNVVYNLKNKSSNAKRCAINKDRRKKRAEDREQS